eukprot:1161865-Pelagomonas_calceolata.AAC.6
MHCFDCPVHPQSEKQASLLVPIYTPAVGMCSLPPLRLVDVQEVMHFVRGASCGVQSATFTLNGCSRSDALR